MSDFTYTVFVIVVSLIGSLAALFAAAVVGVLFNDARHRIETAKTDLPRAA